MKSNQNLIERMKEEGIHTHTQAHASYARVCECKGDETCANISCQPALTSIILSLLVLCWVSELGENMAKQVEPIMCSDSEIVDDIRE